MTAPVDRTGGHARQSVLRTDTSQIGPGPAVAGWLTAWLIGQTVSTLILAVFATTLDEPQIPVVAAGSAATWAAYLIVMVRASHRHGTGRFSVDFGLRFRPLDVVGIPIGVLTQLVVVPLVYVPLRALWPGIFNDQRLSETAGGLADRADGAAVVLLVAVIVVGAPLVEELVYRGLLQRSLSGRTSVVAGWLGVAALFTVIHFRPVEYPGLAVFALIVGATAALTGRLGLPIVTHAAFNATGLLLAYR